jgi:sn-glycerol 3-phosphate transport system substrate-binding protein
LVADFIAFLMRPAIQREWAEGSGYLPLTDAAGITTVAGMDKPPSVFLARAVSERRNLAELRFQNGAGYARLTDILHEELGTIWANVKPPKEALDAAVARGTEALNGGSRREPGKP